MEPSSLQATATFAMSVAINNNRRIMSPHLKGLHTQSSPSKHTANSPRTAKPPKRRNLRETLQNGEVLPNFGKSGLWNLETRGHSRQNADQTANHSVGLDEPADKASSGGVGHSQSSF